MELFSGFVLGLLGSFHCVGMCGPIALAIPAGSQSKRKFIYGRLIYNSGRIISYTAIGLIFGLLGSRIYLFGLQQSLSVIIGSIILITVIISFSRKKYSKNKYISKLLINYKILFSNLFKRKTKSSLLMIGVFNGFLPCGFVYFALSGAVISGDPFTGSLYMMLFGIGTIPLMLAVSVSGKTINLNWRRKLNRLIPVFSIIIALILILRGMSLNIPFISPEINNKVNATSNELICP